jgi:hypothetical protein
MGVPFEVNETAPVGATPAFITWLRVAVKVTGTPCPGVVELAVSPRVVTPRFTYRAGAPNALDISRSGPPLALNLPTNVK